MVLLFPKYTVEIRYIGVTRLFFLKGVWQKKRGVTTGGVLGVHQFSYFFDPLESTNKNKSRNICLYPTNKIRHKRNTCYVRLLSFS